ncbi:MBL fold metallo-hydrolase [Actinomadura decatromicini]|uniref:MBL fold metallo-hydrolase n=1 Tax=Actinomadura decatromicini TaxID=2604572 RepID=A0A5D3FCY9_9ACTN|nr:MBL fold metallo-hydrolase [Actinomadura decatromicini]TYK45969.1 MBL fold metallo-hydrolase [Actinomadura decatromicini]
MSGTESLLNVRYLGGPSAVVRIGGVRLVTDPTFDQAGDYPLGPRTLTKTSDAIAGPDDIGPVDAVLLSHDQHPDNLDNGGRAFLADVPLTLTTETAAGRLGGTARALPNWEDAELPRPDGGTLRVTGVPAQHGPDGTEHITGPVTGFVLSGDGLPTVYVSGDNASLDVVRAIAGRFAPVDVAVLFAGAARNPALDGDLTLGSAAAAEAARILGAGQVVPLHFEGWAHFTEGRGTIAPAFAAAGLDARLHLLEPGEEIGL